MYLAVFLFVLNRHSQALHLSRLPWMHSTSKHRSWPVSDCCIGSFRWLQSLEASTAIDNYYIKILVESFSLFYCNPMLYTVLKNPKLILTLFVYGHYWQHIYSLTAYSWLMNRKWAAKSWNIYKHGCPALCTNTEDRHWKKYKRIMKNIVSHKLTWLQEINERNEQYILEMEPFLRLRKALVTPDYVLDNWTNKIAWR